jgi:hypothetical protein
MFGLGREGGEVIPPPVPPTTTGFDTAANPYADTFFAEGLYEFTSGYITLED